MVTPSELRLDGEDTQDMVNPHFEPTSTEDTILEVLKEEQRANPYLIREQTELGKGDINTALTRLTSAGWVRKVTRGLYEYVEDPRGEVEEEISDEPRKESSEDQRRDTTPAREDRQRELTEEERAEVAERLSGSGDLLEKRVDAIEAMYQELQRLGEAENDELLAVIDPEVVRYTGGEKTSPEESSWSNLVKGKDTLASLPGVESPPEGNTTWRYLGDSQ